jgi:hypothetical protein
MRQVQPETLPKNSNFSSCLQNNMKPARPWMLTHLKIIWQFHAHVVWYSWSLGFFCLISNKKIRGVTSTRLRLNETRFGPKNKSSPIYLGPKNLDTFWCTGWAWNCQIIFRCVSIHGRAGFILFCKQEEKLLFFGDDLFLGPNLVSFNLSLVLVTPRIFLFDIKQKNPRDHEYQTTFNRAVVPLLELSFLAKSQKLTSA